MYIFKTWYILPDSSVGISHVVPLYSPSCGVYSVCLYLDQYQLLFYLKKSCNLKIFMWYKEIKWIQKFVKQTFLPFFLSSVFPHFPSAPISPSPTQFFTCTSISVYVYTFFPLHTNEITCICTLVFSLKNTFWRPFYVGVCVCMNIFHSKRDFGRLPDLFLDFLMWMRVTIGSTLGDFHDKIR